MAVSVPCAADSYLKQVTPILKTCCKTIQNITDQRLNIHPKDRVLPLVIIIHYDSPSIKEKQMAYIQTKIKPSINEEALLLHLRLLRIRNVLTKYFQAHGESMSKSDLSRKTKRLLELKSVIDGFLAVVDKIIENYTFSTAGLLLDGLNLPSLEDLKSNSDLSRKTKRLLELKNGIDGFLAVVDKIIEYYTLSTAGLLLDGLNLPSLEVLKVQKAKICAVNKQFKLKELHSTFADYKDDFMTDANILCALLGLNDDYQHFLDKLDDNKRAHHDDLYYIVRFLEEREKDLEYDPNYKGAEGLYQNLVSLGFTRKRADAISKNIPSELIDLQTPSYWAERYLNNVFLHHPLLYNATRYPYSGDKKDEWFQEEIPTGNREEPNENIPSFLVRMLNCTTKNSVVIEDYLTKVEEEDRESVLLYHGTTHADAKSILTSGITLGSGKTGQDFSSGDGFYVSGTLGGAKKWSDAARGKHSAVLVFKVKKNLLDASKENGLDLTQDEEKWQGIISLCRGRYDNLKVKQILLKGVSFIKGYICSNPKAVADGQERAEGFGQTEIHICIRDEDYAVKFGSLENICCVIFY
ncbi:hypothetical protein Bpfe_005645 [Biomphalaria pfeifferi]|uniref:PARP catalytic domain-containing protein n=1 Tax=Biomphalaria pfeifferi TaxID=112525 RepID=A0AAD8FHC4_BIOPF|nr:hypothetical protein Bpfe_005645 [Biomphalaria pfeifferi]